jgi:hypothetical protein
MSKRFVINIYAPPSFKGAEAAFGQTPNLEKSLTAES